MARTHYDVLGVACDASSDELRAAWRSRARQVHPDTGAADDAEIRALTEAWYVLRDASRRAAYDLEIGAVRWRFAPADAEPDPEAFVSAVGLVEDPPARTRTFDLVVMIPAGLFALAVLSFSLGIALGSASLLAVFLGSLVLSAAGFLLAPFFAMTRTRRR